MAVELTCGIKTVGELRRELEGLGEEFEEQEVVVVLRVAGMEVAPEGLVWGLRVDRVGMEVAIVAA